MRSPKPFILLFLTFLSFTIEAQITDEQHKQIEKICENTFNENEFPGMAVMLWKNGKVVFEKGYGFADRENEIEVDPKFSKFRIGSISKPYTAAGLALLYEAGKVDLDAAVQTYVSYFPPKEYTVSVRQVAGHLGGIRHYKGLEFMNNDYYATVKEGMEIFQDDPLMHEPGSKYSYSSYGWNLISAVMEGCSDSAFLPFMQEYVFDALEMKNTYADINSQDIPGRVQFYQETMGTIAIAPNVDNSYKWAGGGFISTAEDVIKFGVAHLGDSFLKKSTVTEWTKTQYNSKGKATNYGIGWRSGFDKKERPWFGHSGGSVGGTSMMALFPDEQVVVVVLVNLSRASMKDLAFKIANQVME